MPTLDFSLGKLKMALGTWAPLNLELLTPPSLRTLGEARRYLSGCWSKIVLVDFPGEKTVVHRFGVFSPTLYLGLSLFIFF